MKKLIAISILISALTCACTNTGAIIKPNAGQQVQEEVSNIHPIDKAIQDCMSKQDATHEMNKCVYIAMDSWSKEIDKYLNLLKSVTTEEDYNNIELDGYGAVYDKVTTMYYYSESEPELNSDGTAYDGNYWRYVDGVPTPWVKP